MSRRIRTVIQKWETALIAAVDLWTAESRAHISRIEAAEVDAFEVDLRRVTVTREDRNDVRTMAIEAAKCGLTAADVEPMARLWYQTKARARTE